jgi:hypothetical protein
VPLNGRDQGWRRALAGLDPAKLEFVVGGDFTEVFRQRPGFALALGTNATQS